MRERAGWRCEYCHYPDRLLYTTFQCDHISPRAEGGRTVAANLAWCCPWCNNQKRAATRAIDPKTRMPTRLFNPRRDRWQDHFGWSADATTAIGKTPIGRATIAHMKINDELLIMVRKEIIKLGAAPWTESG